VRRYVLGGYGEIPGTIDPNLYDRITNGAEPITERPGQVLEPALERLRRERGVFDSDDDLLLAAFYNRTEYDALKLAGPISTEYPLSSTPLVTLVKELVQRKDLRSFNLVRHQKTTSTGVRNNV